jgi:choline dehydrogenase-like flavoprotein
MPGDVTLFICGESCPRICTENCPLKRGSREWPLDPTLGNHPIGGYHHIGTTRMSASPAEGVVDANCTVHGTANLHVAGSSVFTTGGWANPTLTLLALAHRLARHIDGVLLKN